MARDDERRVRRAAAEWRGGGGGDAGAIAARRPKRADAAMTGANDNLAPVLEQSRAWGAWDLAALWVGLVVCVPTWTLVTGLVTAGMNVAQSLVVVVLGNVLITLPILLQSHPGTKWGVAFPVVARSVFGHRGAHIATFLRAVVAVGWFGIQTYVGGCATHELLQAFVPLPANAAPLPLVGLTADKLACVLAFWAVQVGVVVRGMGAIKVLECASAPVLAALCLLLLVHTAGAAAAATGEPATAALKHVSAPLDTMAFLGQVGPAVTAFVGFWATLALNISDFSRLATSHRSAVVGQALGLPLFSIAFSLVAIAVTACTVSIYGAPVADPVLLIGRIASASASGGAPVVAALGLVGLMIATLSTNVAANVVAPANALAAAFPRQFTFPRAGLLVCVLGVCIQPWMWSGFLITFLLATSVVLGPVLGVMVVDYFLIQKTELDIDALYSSSPGSRYDFSGGYHLAALACVGMATALNVPGVLHAVGLLSRIPPAFAVSFQYSWFTGALLAASLYAACMRGALAR